MMRTLALLSVVVATHGAAVKWTGIVKDNQWTTANNWYPAGVPGSNDDVTIDDAEGVDATVVIVNPTHVGSLSIGGGLYNARLRVLNGLTVARVVDVYPKGTLEMNSGVAGLTSRGLTVSGTFQFAAGTFIGGATIYGVADFGGQAAKVFYNASVSITNTAAMSAAGSLQFKATSHIVSSGSIVSSGQNFQCIVMDTSVGNSFIANGFSWKQ